MELFKKIIFAILLIALVVSYIPSRDTSAQTFSSTSISSGIVSAFSCVAGGVLGNWLSNQIKSWLMSWASAGGIMGKIAGWLGIAQNVPVNDAQIGQYSIQGVIARCIARVVLNKMTGGIIAAARSSGRDGLSSFVRDWRNFKTQAQYLGENIFRAELSQTNLCPQISRQIKTLFGAVNRQTLGGCQIINGQTVCNGANTRVDNLDPFQLRNNCTLPPNFNLANYNRNFSGNGGWQAFARLTQPQNNYYGALSNSLNEAHAQRNFQQGADTSEAVSGQGFTSRRGSTANDSCLIKGQNGQCLVYKDIITPGGSLKDAVSSVFNNELAWVTNVQNLSGLISDLTDLLMSRVLNLSGRGPSVLGNAPPENYPGYTGQPEPDLSGTPVACAPGDPTCCDPATDPTCTAPIQTCTQKGKSDNYLADVQAATATFLAANPAIANALNTDNAAVDALTVGVGRALASQGFRVGRVLEPDNSTFYPQLLAVGRPSDVDATEYRLVTYGSVAPIRDSVANAYCDDHIPWINVVGLGGPPLECNDGIDNDGDGQADAVQGIGVPGLPPDTDCTSNFDNSEAPTTLTQCSDGIDNDSDGLYDFAGGPNGEPADPDCTSATDNSEITYNITVASGTGMTGQLQAFSSSIANLAGSTVGDNTISSITATPITNNTGFIVELCLDPNFGNCTTITPAMVGTGTINDLSTLGLGDNISSIRITQP